MLLFISLFILFAFFLYKFISSKNSDYWKNQNIVQENGVMRSFLFGKDPLPIVYKKIYDKHSSEPHVGVFIGLKPGLLLRSLENIQAVLVGDFQSFSSRGIKINPNDRLGDNILLIHELGRWKLLRQKVSPVFTGAKLKNMFYILDRCGRDLVKRIEENPKIFDVPFEALYTYSTASIAASVFGIDAQIKNTMDSPFVLMTKKSTDPSLTRDLLFTIANSFPRITRLFNLKIFGNHEEFFIGVVRNVMETRRRTKEVRHDFIDLCLELQDEGLMKNDKGDEIEATVEVLAAQAFFFFIAGADTSASTMNYTLAELSKYPDVLEKVHQEVDKLFEGAGETLTYNDIEKLNYLDMVINETLRKYPPVGSIQRSCTKDTVLPVGGVKMQKDVLAIVPIYAIHRDAKIFPDPDKFDPERFSPENIEKIPKYAYLPFGEGNHICLGMRYSKLQIKAGLVWLLRHYTLKPKSYTPQIYEHSSFAIRDPNIRYGLLKRAQNTHLN